MPADVEIIYIGVLCMNKRRKMPGIWFVIISVFLLYFAYVFYEQEGILQAKAWQMKRIRDRIDEQEKVNRELQKQKEILDSDEYIEKIAREKLGMVKQGEKIFRDKNK